MIRSLTTNIAITLKHTKMANKVPKNGWYCTKKSAYQISLYKLFVERKNIPIEKIIECIDKFSPERKHISKKKYNLDYINEHFSEFLKLVTEETGVTFKKRYGRSTKIQSWDEHWQECNLNGSFAYNGVTDDF